MFSTATKLKIYGGLAKAKQALDRTVVVGTTALAGVLGSGIVSSAEGPVASAPTIDFSSVDLSGLTATIISAVPQVLPVSVTMVGIRKGISFFLGTLRGC